MNGRHRTSIALTAAALLTGAGAAVVANGAPAHHPVAVTKPSPLADPSPDPQTVGLERSVSDLLTQVGDLEAAIAASAIPEQSGPATSSTSRARPTARADAGRGSASTRTSTAAAAPATTEEQSAANLAAPAAPDRAVTAPQSRPTEDDHAFEPEPREDSHEDGHDD